MSSCQWLVSSWLWPEKHSEGLHFYAFHCKALQSSQHTKLLKVSLLQLMWKWFHHSHSFLRKRNSGSCLWLSAALRIFELLLFLFAISFRFRSPKWQAECSLPEPASEDTCYATTCNWTVGLQDSENRMIKLFLERFQSSEL